MTGSVVGGGMRIVTGLLLVALLAGCSQPTDGTDPTPTTGDAGFAPQSHHAEARSDRIQGVVAEGDLSECPEGFCVMAQARNEGNDTAYVQVLCEGPWQENVTQGGTAIQHREPTFVCQAFQLEAFQPGSQQFFGPKWNGTVWVDERQAYEAAPQGAYVWRVSFEVFTSRDGEGRHRLDLDFPVVVGPT